MPIKYLILAGLALIVSCTTGGTSESRAQRLAGQVVKMIRFEHMAMAGRIALEGELGSADRLFQETVK